LALLPLSACRLSCTLLKVLEIKRLYPQHQLAQNFPNLFSPSTIIRYSLPTQSSVSLKIYNINGQLITTLVNDVNAVGNFNVEWNGKNEFGFQVASGVYIYKIEANSIGGSAFTDVKMMLLLKCGGAFSYLCALKLPDYPSFPSNK